MNMSWKPSRYDYEMLPNGLVYVYDRVSGLQSTYHKDGSPNGSAIRGVSRDDVVSFVALKGGAR